MPVVSDIASNVRLIGQPFTISQYTVTLLLVCHCPANASLLLAQGATVQCTACQRTYTIGGIKASVNGTLQFGIQMGTPSESES